MPNQSPGVIRLTIKVEGEAIATTTEIESVSIQNELDRIPYARIRINDGSPATAEFPISDSVDVEIGKEIEVLAGYQDEEESLFKGVILAHKLRAGSSGCSLTIEARHPAFKTSLQLKEKLFLEQKDSAIVETICGEYGLTPDIEATDVEFPQVVQYRATDWDFMLKRLNSNGQHLLCVAGGITAKAPDMSEEACLTLTFGENILDFDLEADARSQVKGVETIAWNSTTQELEKLEGADPGLPDLGDLVVDDLSGAAHETNQCIHMNSAPVEGQLQKLSDSFLTQSRMAKVRGRVRAQGNSLVVPGSCIELVDVGKHFTGTHYVKSVSHEIGNGDWNTNIEVGLDALNLFMEKEQLQDLPAISGLHLATVLQITEAPDDEARVQVNLPLINASDEGIWARMTSPDAGASDEDGKGRGIYFMPEVGDEVVVGFLGGDPRGAVVMGMLHNSKMPSPVEVDETNSTKGIYTRANLQLIFDDDKKIIELVTPENNRISMDEDQTQILIEDQNENSILLNADGITITSSKDLIFEVPGDMKVKVDGDLAETIGGKQKVECKGEISVTGKAAIKRTATGAIKDTSKADIKLTATGNVDIKATADAKMAGLNVNHTANAQFVAKGNAGAEVSTSAIAILKGSLVQIN
ncbi:hypothetical protein BVY04_04685 [bacterium M21]|nr:hypothetical protein BVY04_04685 [bacterium M21]